ncbi:hypothetical protein J31TS4_14840 [Paenibacillus sp. J31TS4]|nr:hypothetical protein J31TS4_14840 [Paenibacillus sp. J31TS4]
MDRTKPASDKTNLKYTIMIRQPDFLTEEWFRRFLEQTKKKKSNPFLEKVRFEHVEEGLCCQMMHLASIEWNRSVETKQNRLTFVMISFSMESNVSEH